jgi:hypothetical protein
MKNIVITALGSLAYALIAFIASSIDIVLDLLADYAVNIMLCVIMGISILFLLTALLSHKTFTEDQNYNDKK